MEAVSRSPSLKRSICKNKQIKIALIGLCVPGDRTNEHHGRLDSRIERL